MWSIKHLAIRRIPNLVGYTQWHKFAQFGGGRQAVVWGFGWYEPPRDHGSSDNKGPGGKISAEQEALRRTYEKLGAIVDDDRGILKGSTNRALDSLSLSFWLLRQEQSRYLERDCRCSWEEKCICSNFALLYLECLIASGRTFRTGRCLFDLGKNPIWCLSGCNQPLRVTDMRAKLHEVVLTLDTSEIGGGSIYRSRLITIEYASLRLRRKKES